MLEQKQFILQFLTNETECWTKSELGNLDAFNQSVKELYAMAIKDLDEAFGIICEKKFKEEENPITFSPGYLFKLSHYRHPHFGLTWLGYTSYKNPFSDADNTGISRAFIFSEIEAGLKIIGMMSVTMRDSDLQPIGWKKSIYNPSNIDIRDPGEFVSTERYHEPMDDGFSREDYWEDK